MRSGETDGVAVQGKRWTGWPQLAVAAAVGLVVAVAVVAVFVAPGGSAQPAVEGEAAAAADEPGMTITQVVVISVVEGVTEFLPVSSTGHILLAQRMLGMNQTSAADAFAICIQAGAILAVIGLYYQRTQQMAWGMLGRDEQGLKLASNLVVAFLPFMVVALLFYEPIMAMFGLRPSVAMWFVGGLVILWVAWWLRDRSPQEGLVVEQVTARAALVIGLIQCFAVIPGVSRALVAILGGLAVGMSVRAAVEFSFLLGIITLVAAAVYEGWGNGFAIFEAYGWFVPLVGVVVAGLSAAAAVKWMVSYLDRYSMAIFGYYRIILAIAVGAMLAMGMIEG